MSAWVVPGFIQGPRLGRGGAGAVFAGVNAATGQRVAIKYLSRDSLRNQALVTRFRAEADLLRSVAVPQVVQVYGYVEETGRGAAIIMELVDGVSLSKIISKHGGTSPEAALLVLKGSLLGLGAAHALGIVHRDYKPENILVDAEGSSKLADFGVAVRAGRNAPSEGTPEFMAPEQWQDGPATPATDVYAATAVFFECLTGQPPFCGKLGELQRQHAFAPVPVERVDERLRGLIERGLAKNTADRPWDAIALVRDLEAAAVAACGPDWEDLGRAWLRDAAAALLLAGAGGAVGGGTGLARDATWLDMPKAVAIAAGAVALVVMAGAGATALIFAGGSNSGSPPNVNVVGTHLHPTPSAGSSASVQPTRSGGIAGTDPRTPPATRPSGNPTSTGDAQGGLKCSPTARVIPPGCGGLGPTPPPPPPTTSPPPPTPPTAGLTVTQTAAATVEADASASTAGSQPIASYDYDWGDGEATGAQPAATATHTYAADGTYTVKVTVTDAAGNTSHPFSATITVGPPSGPITLAGTNYCLDGTNDVNVIVDVCDGSAGQQWTLAANHELQTLGGCLDDHNVIDGFSLWIVPCTGANGENGLDWELFYPQGDGTIVQSPGTPEQQCLISEGADARAVVTSCSTAASQFWNLPTYG